MSVLGSSQHQVFVQQKCRGPRLCQLSGVTELQYDRRLDDISQAVVTVSISGDVDEPCCECLGSSEPFCHALTIVREGDGVVWYGPIVDIDYGYNTVTIEANDNLVWLTKRVNEIDVTWGYPNTTIELTTMAKTLIEVAMADEDGGCVLDCVLDLGDGLPAGTDRSVDFGIRSPTNPNFIGFPAFGGPTAYDDLLALTNSGIDVTAINHCILLSGEGLPSVPIGILTDEMILGEVSIRKNGRLAANRVYSRYADDDDDTECSSHVPSAPTPCPAVAEGDQECYGLLEMVTPDPGEVADLASAQVLAEIYMNASRLVPRTIEFPSGTKLSPDCPWGLNDMIPGQRLDVALSKLCVPIYQAFKLQEVSVVDNAEGEEIS